MELFVAFLYVACFAGAASSILMIKAVSRGPQRLLNRQLFHQAVATLLLDGSMFALITWGLMDSSLGTTCLGTPDNGVAATANRFMHAVYFAVCLLEMHIAASIVAVVSHAQSCLRWLGRWLPAVWLIATIYGAESEIAGIVSDPEMQSLAAISDDKIGAVLVLCCGMLTISLYVFAMIRTNQSHAPHAVLQRMHRRAMVYPLVFTVSFVPSSLRYLGIIQTCNKESPIPWGILSITSEGLVAVGNAVGFWAFNRRGRASNRVAIELPGRPALAVGFSENTEVLEFEEETGLWRSPLQWKDPSPQLEQEADFARRESEEVSQSESFWREYVGDDV